MTICVKDQEFDLTARQAIGDGLDCENFLLHLTGLTGNILVGEWQIALLVYFRRVMECSCKSTLKICRLEFCLISFTNSKLFLPFTFERKVFDC